MEQILSTYGPPTHKETITAIMTLYKNTRAVVVHLMVTPTSLTLLQDSCKWIHLTKENNFTLKKIRCSFVKARGIGVYVKADKTQFMCFKQDGAISILSGKPLKLIDQFTHFGSNISSTESNVGIGIWKAESAIEMLSII